jgi:hypothetical protein
MKKERTAQRVWTGRAQRSAKGTLEPLLINGQQPTYTYIFDYARRLTTTVPVFLFNSKRYWWLHYAPDFNTGHFKSKKAAVDWWVKGGR